MRLLALFPLTVVLALTGCPTANPPDGDCISAGGVCFKDMYARDCNATVSGDCAKGYFCCAAPYGGNIGPDGAFFDALPGFPPEASTDAVADASDGALKSEAGKHSDAESDAKTDAPATTKDGATDATKDGTIPSMDSGHSMDAAHDVGQLHEASSSHEAATDAHESHDAVSDGATDAPPG